MAFSVSYTYKILDKFTPQLRKIEEATDKFNKKIMLMANSSRLAGQNLKNMGSDATGAASTVARAADKIDKSLTKIKKKTDALGKDKTGGFGAFGSRMSKLSGKIQGGAGSIGAIAGSVGAGLGLKTAASAAMNLEDSIINLQKGFDFAPGQLEPLQEKLASIANEIGRSKVEMNNMAYEAGKLGIALEDVAGFGLLSGKFAVAFDSNIEEAAKSMAQLRNQMALDTNEKLAKFLDTVNYAADKTSASGEGILDIIARTTGIMGQLKVPEDLRVALAATAQQITPGGRPELAASGLEMMLQRIQSKEFPESIRKGMLEDMPGTLNKIFTVLDKLNPQDQGMAMQQLFGLNAATFVSSLMANRDVLTKTMGITQDENKVGSMDKEFAKKQAAASFKFEQLKANLTNIASDVGTVLLPVIKEFSEWIVKIAPAVSAWVKENPGVTKFALTLVGILAVLAPIGLGISAIVNGIGALATTAAFASKSLVFLFGLMKTGLPVVARMAGAMALPFIKFAVIAWGLYQTFKLIEEVASSMSNIGFMNTVKDMGGAVLDTLGFEEAAMNLSGTKSMNAAPVTLDGQIGVSVTGPGKVTQTNFVTPTNRGSNIVGSNQ